MEGRLKKLEDFSSDSDESARQDRRKIDSLQKRVEILRKQAGLGQPGIQLVQQQVVDPTAGLDSWLQSA